MGRKRTITNKKLPERWFFRCGSYYYIVPPKERGGWDNKNWFMLGKTYPEALRTFADRKELETGETVSGVIDRYTIDTLSKLKPQSQLSYLRSLGRIKTILGHNRIGLITPQIVYQYLEHIRKAHGMNSANIDLKVFVQVVDCAVRVGVINSNGIRGNVKYFGARDGLKAARERYVEDWELSEWTKEARPVQRAFAAICMLTGARKSDILRLKRSDIKADHLLIRCSKTGKDALFVMTDALRAAVDYAISIQPKNKPSFWLLPNRSGQCYVNDQDASKSFDISWQRSMARAKDKTKLSEAFTRHDLRAKVGSDADSDNRAQELLGHSTVGMTQKHYRRKVPIIQPTR